VAAHDLQEPLRTVKAHSQLFARRYSNLVDKAGEEVLGYVMAGVDRMEALVQDLRVYTEVRESTAAAALVNANDAIHNTIRSLDFLIRDSSATIDVEPLPMVYVSSAHLSQIFQNLISNAIKYRGESRPEIHISCRRSEHEAEFIVADNGMGIEHRYREHIFGVFRRLHGREIPGTGIGLAICKRIVELYGGRIWVVSELGKGSEFHFTMPSALTAETESGS